MRYSEKEVKGCLRDQSIQRYVTFWNQLGYIAKEVAEDFVDEMIKSGQAQAQEQLNSLKSLRIELGP